MAPGIATGQTLADVGEFGLIDAIRRTVPEGVPGVVTGIGDDTAALRPTPGLLTLVTCDIQVEGRHFIKERTSARQLGRRCAAINLSDIAAMGGRPTHALVSLVLPPGTRVDWVQELYQGMNDEMSPWGAGLIGGNVSSGESIAIDVTLLGEVAEEMMLRRGGAMQSDRVLVTGALGASAAGRLALDRGLDAARSEVAEAINAHLAPKARVAEGAAIAALVKATAMIDISDGIAGDLGHICGASGAAARLVAERVPIAPSARALAPDLDMSALDLALQGGEDYELAFTCPAEDAATVAAAVMRETGTAVTEIGTITPGRGLTLVLGDGSETQVPGGGWDHFLETPKG